MHKVGYHDFSSHSSENFRRGTLLCFREFPVSKNFMHIKILSKIFRLTVPKNFVGEPSYVSVTIFRRNNTVGKSR